METAEGQKLPPKSSSISLQMVTSQLGDMFVVKISSIGFTVRGPRKVIAVVPLNMPKLLAVNENNHEAESKSAT